MATITKPIALDETLQRIAVAEEAKAANANLIYLPIVGSLTDTIKLDPTKAIYRATPTVSTTTVTIPTPDISDIPTASAYFCFELEIAVDAAATTLVGPGSADGWTYLEGGDLPDGAAAAGKTVYISCRLDCTTRMIVANVWRVV